VYAGDSIETPSQAASRAESPTTTLAALATKIEHISVVLNQRLDDYGTVTRTAMEIAESLVRKQDTLENITVKQLSFAFARLQTHVDVHVDFREKALAKVLEDLLSQLDAEISTVRDRLTSLVTLYRTFANKAKDLI
jgi:hypothetical protein